MGESARLRRGRGAWSARTRFRRARSTRGAGAEADECPFRCSPGFFFEEATGTCDACRVVEECEDGESLGGQCSHESNPTCDECTDIPANADPIDNVCGWVCATNYTQNAEGTACVACRTSCGAGMYLSGACTNVEAPVCRVCTGAPANAAYTSAGSDGVDDCEFVCGEALFYSVVHEPVPGVHCSRGLCSGAGCVWSVRECD